MQKELKVIVLHLEWPSSQINYNKNNSNKTDVQRQSCSIPFVQYALLGFLHTILIVIPWVDAYKIEFNSIMIVIQLAMNANANANAQFRIRGIAVSGWVALFQPNLAHSISCSFYYSPSLSPFSLRMCVLVCDHDLLTLIRIILLRIWKWIVAKNSSQTDSRTHFLRSLMQRKMKISSDAKKRTEIVRCVALFCA